MAGSRQVDRGGRPRALLARHLELAAVRFDQLARERQAEAAAPPLGLAVGAEPACLAIALEIAGEGRRAIVEPGAEWLGRLTEL